MFRIENSVDYIDEEWEVYPKVSDTEEGKIN